MKDFFTINLLYRKYQPQIINIVNGTLEWQELGILPYFLSQFNILNSNSIHTGWAL